MKRNNLNSENQQNLNLPQNNTQQNLPQNKAGQNNEQQSGNQQKYSNSSKREGTSEERAGGTKEGTEAAARSSSVKASIKHEQQGWHKPTGQGNSGSNRSSGQSGSNNNNS